MENKNAERYRQYEEERLIQKTVPSVDYMKFMENHLRNIANFNSWYDRNPKKKDVNPESKTVLGVKNQ